MFERLDQNTRRVIARAHHEAYRSPGKQIDCGHLLLGMLIEPGPAANALAAAGLEVARLRAQMPPASRAEPDALDADALATLGIDLDAVRRAADAAFGPGALDRAQPPSPGRGRRGTAGRVRMDDEAKKALGLALGVAAGLGHRSITTGHLLIGVIDQGDNAALTALAACGVDGAALRADVLTRLAVAA